MAVVTNASLHAGNTVMEAWGFTCRSCLTWIKPSCDVGVVNSTSCRFLQEAVKG
jgi:N6-adenosine-specific RNA methylase IME4